MKLSRLKTLPAAIVVMTATTVGVSVTPAAAAALTLNNGTGAFTAVAVATFVPPPGSGIGGTSSDPCAIYTLYHANLNFASGQVVDIESAPTRNWGEGPTGTFDDPVIPDCAGATTDAISGFGGTFRTTTGSVCTLTDGTYRRGFGRASDPWDELNVRFVFGTVTGGGDCPTALTIDTTIGRVDYGTATLAAIANGSTTANGLPGPAGIIGGGVYDAFVGGQVYAAACAGLIAPPGCVLRPVGQGSLGTTP